MKIKRCFSRDKKGIATEFLPWLLIGIAVLVIVMITILLLREEGVGIIDRIKNLFSFR